MDGDDRDSDGGRSERVPTPKTLMPAVTLA